METTKLKTLDMKNQDRAEVLRGKARILTYEEINAVIIRAAELDDGTTEYSVDGYAWNPDCYAIPAYRVNEVGRAVGGILFSRAGCSAAAFDALLPAFNEALERKSRQVAAVAAA